MKDIQNLHDSRRIDIRKVGVKNITYPITVLDKARSTQQTVASVNMYVNLPHKFKGTHMSRFIEILNHFHGRFQVRTLHLVLQEMKNRLDAEAAHLEISFPYFFSAEKQIDSFRSRRYDCCMHGSLEDELDLIVKVEVPVSLNPGPGTDAGFLRHAGGLWGKAAVSVRLSHFFWLEDLINLIEKGSEPESDQQDTAESICRRLSNLLSSDSAFSWYRVIVENITSGYSTFASVEGP